KYRLRTGPTRNLFPRIALQAAQEGSVDMAALLHQQERHLAPAPQRGPLFYGVLTQGAHKIEFATVIRPPTAVDRVRRQALGDPVPILTNDAHVTYGADFLDLLINPVTTGRLHRVGFGRIDNQERAIVLGMGGRARKSPLAVAFDQACQMV